MYKDDDGKDVVLNCVRKAEERIFRSSPHHSYLPFSGLASFTKLTSEFAFGKESRLLQEGRVAAVHTISGTGALRVGAEFLARNLRRSADAPLPPLYLPEPTYVNHMAIFSQAGFELRRYRYYEPASCGLDADGMLADLRAAPRGSVFLFHACAHNPTGVDPEPEHWRALAQVARERDAVSFFDSAYQGFATGDPDRDASAFRHFAEAGLPILVAQSYSKNFGLYGQRVGALLITTASRDESRLVLSRLNQVVRPMYSNPPLHGARIVQEVFSDPELTQLWRQEVRQMAERIAWCRRSLVAELARLGSRRNWQHIERQIGMFAYSGLRRHEVEHLRRLHVYMNFDGRMSISGINSKNLQYLAKCMHEATS